MIPRDAREVYCNDRGDPVAFCPADGIGLSDLERGRFYGLVNDARLRALSERARTKTAETGTQHLVVAIDVDDPSWADLVGTLMPGFDWDAIRKRGEHPIARGVVPAEPMVDLVAATYPAAGKGAQATLRHAHEADATGAVQHKGNAASGNEACTLIAFVAEAESGNGGNGATVDAAPPCRVGSGIAVGGAVAVRRLTPRECERLQGFPDDWTAIEWRGKPAPDSLRYKAVGNAVAVPVVAWIAERLRRALR